MSRARLSCALLGLGVGLLFYLAHRTDHTVSNRVLAHLGGAANYAQLKQHAREWLPVPVALRGCLPSALWCFIATSLLGGWQLRVGRDRFLRASGLCPLFNGAWEGVQWLGWTDGRGDPGDIIAGVAGWLLASAVLVPAGPPAEVTVSWRWRAGLMVTAVACIGLADVWR
jgi:hypothetical protein